MDGADEHSLFRRQSTKRSFSTMASHHRDASSSSHLIHPRPTDHGAVYAPDYSRGFALPPMRDHPPAARFAGDGLDYRRPVMGNMGSSGPVIDLTADDNVQEGSESRGVAPQPTARASRPPRFGRVDIINIEDSPEGGAGASSASARDHGWGSSMRPAPPPLPLPVPHFRSTVSQLRRPARLRPRSPMIVDADDDLEILSERHFSRPATTSMSRQHTPAVAPTGATEPRSITPFPADLGAGGDDLIDLTADDDVVHLNTRPREGGINAGRPGVTGGVGTRHSSPVEDGHGFRIADMVRRNAGNGRHQHHYLDRQIGAVFGDPRRRHYHFHAHAPIELGDEEDEHNPLFRAPRPAGAHRHHHRIQAGGFDFAGPVVGLARGHARLDIQMNYDDAGFDLGFGGGPRAASPKYEAPPPPGEGFTRNPSEDEVVVCPNCGDELAVTEGPTNAESEIKQQVWIVKSCGHAYCGDCAQNRARKVSKKGKAKVTEVSNLPAPFKHCVVDGCGKSAHNRGMIQVYLGS